MSALHTALENVCADLERFAPHAPSLHFARGLLAAPSARGPRPMDLPEIEILKAWDAGENGNDLASRFGVSNETIYRLVRKFGRGGEGRPRGPRLGIAGPEMVTDYEGGMSLGEVAQKYRRSPQTIRNWLVRAGVTIRPKGQCVKIDNDRIDRIMQMNADGMNLQQIGNVLGISRERVRQLVVKAGRKADWIEHQNELTFEQREAIDLYREGMSLALAANKAGVSLVTFRKYLATAGVSIRPSQKLMRRKERADQKAAQVVRLYQEGLSGKEIAEQSGLPHAEAVYRHLARAGIEPTRRPNAGKVLS